MPPTSKAHIYRKVFVVDAHKYFPSQCRFWMVNIENIKVNCREKTKALSVTADQAKHSAVGRDAWNDLQMTQ